MWRRRGDGAQAGERRRGDSDGDGGGRGERRRGGGADAGERGCAATARADGDVERRPVEPQRVAEERRMCGSPGGAAAGRRRSGDVRVAGEEPQQGVAGVVTEARRKAGSSTLSEKSLGVPTP